MPKYAVTLPIAGEIYVEIEAESEEDALENAKSNATIDDVTEWDCYERYNSGNVCYISTAWEESVEEIEE